MDDANVKSACDNAGLVTPCPGNSECKFNDKYCTVTSEQNCNNGVISLTIGNVLKNVCKTENSPDCPQFDGVYQYMKNFMNGNTCGVENKKGEFCSDGSKYSNRFALCAKKIGTF